MTEEFLNMIKENRSRILGICRFYAICNGRETKDDLFQEIVLNLWSSYPKFIKNQQCKPSTWLYRVALNTALLQKRNEHNIIFTQFSDENINAIQEKDDNDINRQLYELIKELNSEEQTIIYLYLDNLSHKEMAEILGISVSNVGTKIQRIKLKLNKLNNKSR